MTFELANDSDPWLAGSWLGEASDWIHQQLIARELPPAGPIETVKSWSVSRVLRVSTTRGDVYFKAVPRLFAAEPVVTRLLAEWCPEHVPDVLAIDAERGWLLVRDGGQKLRAEPSAYLQARYRRAAMRALAELQRASIDRTADLLAAGATDRRLPQLVGQLDALLAEAASLDDADPQLLGRVGTAAPDLRSMAARLGEIGIPDTLVHGDFHPGNVAIRDREVVIFDWANAGVSHPFLDVVTFLDEDATGREAPDEDSLREAYLGYWRDYARPARLRQAFELGKTLGALQQAIMYQRIMRGLGPAGRHTCAGGIRIALRYVLQRLDR
jgi:Phosphotransferase enzyme family